MHLKGKTCENVRHLSQIFLLHLPMLEKKSYPKFRLLINFRKVSQWTTQKNVNSHAKQNFQSEKN